MNVKKKAAKKKVAPKAKAKAKRSPKPKPVYKPFEYKKLERLTYKQFKALDPCFEADEWWKKSLGKNGVLELKTEAVGPSLFPSREAVVNFDFLWPSWLLRQLAEKLVDQMDLNYVHYGRECKRLYKISTVFERECNKAARESALTHVTIYQRTTNAIVVCIAMMVAYKNM